MSRGLILKIQPANEVFLSLISPLSILNRGALRLAICLIFYFDGIAAPLTEVVNCRVLCYDNYGVQCKWNHNSKDGYRGSFQIFSVSIPSILWPKLKTAI